MPNGLESGTDLLIEQITKRLSARWRLTSTRLLRRLRKLNEQSQLSRTTAIFAIRHELGPWYIQAFRDVSNLVHRLFSAGFWQGASGVDSTQSGSIAQLEADASSFVRSLNLLTADAISRVEKSIGEQVYLDTVATAIEETGTFTENRLHLILRTETAQAANSGRLAAWSADPYRDWYKYLWSTMHDNRVKDISIIFEDGNPYDFIGIKHTWEILHNTPQLVRNRHTGKMVWQTSCFNCRCTLFRIPKAKEQLYNEGKIGRAEYNEVGGIT